MSIISIKGTKSEPVEEQARARFMFGNGERLSKVPLYFALAITGLAAYLKSAFPAAALAHPNSATQPAGKPATQQSAESIASAEMSSEPQQDESHHRIRQPLPFPSKQYDYDPIEVSIARKVSARLDSFAFEEPTPTPIGSSRSRAANDNAAAPLEDVPNSPSEEHKGLVEESPHGTEGDAPPLSQDPAIAEDDDGPADTPTPQVPGPSRNRQPASTGSVRLNDVMAGQAALIGLSQLLSHNADADGDVLVVSNPRVSAGSIGWNGEGWVFSSNRQSEATTVTLTYDVSDGTESIIQTATFEIKGRVPQFGTAGDDTIVGLQTDDDIEASAGNDLVDARGGDDFIIGGEGDDHILAGAGNDVVNAGGGADVVLAGAGNDLVSGGAGDDRLFGEDGDDTLAGETGDDLVVGGDGNDAIDGGDGNDELTGDLGNDVLSGGSGDDTIDGGEGNDRIQDGAGEDDVSAGSGDDVTLVALDQRADTFDGGYGKDLIEFSQATGRLLIDLTAGRANGVEIGIESVSNYEIVISGSGDDEITDGLGSESISAGSGNDYVHVAMDALNDAFAGGSGEDVLDLHEALTGVVVDHVHGTVTSAESGTDNFEGFETFVGGSGDDRFIVGSTAVTLLGGEGRDAFYFDVASRSGATTAELIHKILDFMVGDQVFVAEYEFRKIQNEGGQDRFERVYRATEADLDDDEFLIRLRDPVTDQVDFAVIDVDRDRDDVFEFSIEIYGYGHSSPYPVANSVS